MNKYDNKILLDIKLCMLFLDILETLDNESYNVIVAGILSHLNRQTTLINFVGILNFLTFF